MRIWIIFVICLVSVVVDGQLDDPFTSALLKSAKDFYEKEHEKYEACAREVQPLRDDNTRLKEQVSVLRGGGVIDDSTCVGSKPQELAAIEEITTSPTDRNVQGTGTWNPQVTQEDVIKFMQDGHIILRNFLPDLADYRDEIMIAANKAEIKFNAHTLEYMGCKEWLKDPQVHTNATFGRVAIDECNTAAIHNGLCTALDYGDEEEPSADEEELLAEPACFVPYYQQVHLHKQSPRLMKLATSYHFGSAAASLIRTRGVRLYQTALFVKDPASDVTHLNAPTAWHNDLNQVPVDTNGYVTFWCPLTPVKDTKDATLEYASGSHRDISLYYWFPPMTPGWLRRFKVEHYKDIKVGDCLAHHGWVFHQSVPNESDHARKAIGFSYIDGQAWKLPSESRRSHFREVTDEDALSYEDWFRDIADVEHIKHAELPQVFPTYDNRVNDMAPGNY